LNALIVRFVIGRVEFDKKDQIFAIFQILLIR
jgi:hypothetical protein